MPFEDVAFPRSVQGLNGYTLNSKSLPIHARGALSFNEMILNRKLTKKYELIQEGEKIKFCYLRMPNTTRHNVLAIATILPPEFGVESMIDYQTQFDKSFIQPISAILNVIGWSAQKTNTLDGFFA